MIPFALSAMLLYACFAIQSRDRGPTTSKLRWNAVFLCLLIAWAMPHPGAAILVAVAGLNLWRFPMPSEKVHQSLYPVCAFAGAFALIGQQMTPAMVVPILWGFVVTGTLLGLWGVYALCYFGDCVGFMHHFKIRGRYLFSLYEPNRDHGFECAQGNPNHAQAMGALCTAAGVGLIYLGSWQAWFLLPLLLVPIIGIQLKSRSTHPTQGIFYLLQLAVFSLPVWLGTIGWYVIGGYLLLLVLIAQPWTERSKKWWDSGRLKHWKKMWKLYWWNQSWPVKLTGCGTGSWIATIYTHATIHFKQTKEKQLLMTSAHNEYLHVWIEHGLIGVVAMCWYMGSTIERAFFAGPEGVAVYFIGITLASIALISFPFTFYHEVYLDEIKQVRGHGSPSLQAASLVIAILGEAVR